MPSTISRKLLVEGNTDKRVIPFLMEANGVEWERSGEPVVCIAPYGSVDELLKPGVVEAELRASRLEALGLMVDTNGDAFDRWNRIRSLCHDEFEHLPDRIPRGGLEIVHPESDVRYCTKPRIIGYWTPKDRSRSRSSTGSGASSKFRLPGRIVTEPTPGSVSLTDSTPADSSTTSATAADAGAPLPCRATNPFHGWLNPVRTTIRALLRRTAKRTCSSSGEMKMCDDELTAAANEGCKRPRAFRTVLPGG